MPRLIDEDKAKEVLTDYYHISTDIQQIALEEAFSRVPTVDAEPVRHGKWKPMDLTWGRSIYYCTNCETSAEVPTEMGKPIYSFCPNCGAKMHEEKENDTQI